MRSWLECHEYLLHHRDEVSLLRQRPHALHLQTRCTQDITDKVITTLVRSTIDELRILPDPWSPIWRKLQDCSFDYWNFSSISSCLAEMQNYRFSDHLLWRAWGEMRLKDGPIEHPRIPKSFPLTPNVYLLPFRVILLAHFHLPVCPSVQTRYNDNCLTWNYHFNVEHKLIPANKKDLSIDMSSWRKIRHRTHTHY